MAKAEFGSTRRVGARNTRWRLFAATWAIATVVLLWHLRDGPPGFDNPSTPLLPLLGLACTAALIWWLPGPRLPDQPGRTQTCRFKFALAAGGLVLALSLIFNLTNRSLLLGFPFAALLVLLVLRSSLNRRELGYSLFLALVAGLAGLGFGERFTGMYPLNWGALQVPLVLFCLPAGWAILRHTGLLQAGLGGSRFLADGAGAALRACGWGLAIGTPWALLNVALGGGASDPWLRDWWQAFAALQPGIAEEAWARVFLVALLFWPLRKFASDRTALLAAVLIAGYWFAYLHSPTGLGGLVSAALVGTLWSLPLSFIWLRRGLEAAIGFHFWQDFLRFGAAYLVNSGVWFGG
jgi:hypothetical protein